MATSGSGDFSLNKSQIISAALRKIGAIYAQESPSADVDEQATLALNSMLRATAAQAGYQLFKNRRGTVFLQKNQIRYLLGQEAGDHSAYDTDVIETSASAAASAADAISVGSSSAIAALDFVGVELSSGSLHWTTVSAASSDIISLVSAVASAVPAGAQVYTYTTKIRRPIAIRNVNLSLADRNEYELRAMSTTEYQAVWDKDQSGTPVSWFYDPQIELTATGGGALFVDYAPNEVREKLKIVFREPFEDLDDTADIPDVPVEWYNYLIWGLAADLGPEYISNVRFLDRIMTKAELERQRIMSLYADGPREVKPW